MKKKVKKIENIKVDVPVSNLEYWFGDFHRLLPNSVYQLVIDYPLSTNGVFNIKTGEEGMGLPGLLKEIGKAYNNVYDNEEKYGVWGHDMDDLAIEGIKINHETKTIKLDVGS